MHEVSSEIIKGRRWVGPSIVAYVWGCLVWLKFLNFYKSYYSVEVAGEEERCKQQQVFLVDIDCEVKKLETLKNKIEGRVLLVFLHFRVYRKIRNDLEEDAFEGSTARLRRGDAKISSLETCFTEIERRDGHSRNHYVDIQRRILHLAMEHTICILINM